MSQQNLNIITEANLNNFEENIFESENFSKNKNKYKLFLNLCCAGLLFTVSHSSSPSISYSQEEIPPKISFEYGSNQSQDQISEKFIEIDESMIVNPLSMFDEKDYFIDRIKNNEKINLNKINEKLKNSNIDIETLLLESRRI